MRRWLLADRDTRCGYAWCVIPAGAPYQVIEGVGPLRVRCREHASGQPDMDAILADAEARAVRVESATTFSPIRRMVADQRRLFDPKALAAGRDE